MEVAHSLYGCLHQTLTSMTILHSFGICVAYLLVSQGFVHATIEIIDSFGRKVKEFPNRYATVIECTMEGYIESANPSDACTEIDPPTFSTNFTMKKMVLINGTTTCDFVTKVQNAKAVGYDIAVLFDPSPEPFNYTNMTFPLLDANLSVVLLLYEDAIVIRKNFLYHNISDKENFIISISSNAQNPSLLFPFIFGGLFLAGILTFCCYSVIRLWRNESPCPDEYRGPESTWLITPNSSCVTYSLNPHRC